MIPSQSGGAPTYIMTPVLSSGVSPAVITAPNPSSYLTAQFPMQSSMQGSTILPLSAYSLNSSSAARNTFPQPLLTTTTAGVGPINNENIRVANNNEQMMTTPSAAPDAVRSDYNVLLQQNGLAQLQYLQSQQEIISVGRLQSRNFLESAQQNEQRVVKK